MVELQAELRQFLRTEARRQEGTRVCVPLWQGMVYAGICWEDAAFGAVLQDSPEYVWLQGSVADTDQRTWKFMLGMKEYAASAPVGWSIHPEADVNTGPEYVVAVARHTPPYRLLKARGWAGTCVSF